jgi:phage terminase large subunit
MILIGMQMTNENIYTLLPWQVAPWKDKAPILLLTGAAGGGKSRLAAEKINTYLEKYPGATGLVLRKAREYCNKSVVPFLRYTIIGKGASYVEFKKSDGLFQYANGSVLYVGGMKDQGQREAIRSIGQEGALDIAWLEEANAFTIEDYEELLARMRGKAAKWSQVILTTNPDDSYHWINTRLIQAGEAATYYSSYRQNPYLPQAYFDVMDKLTGVRRERLRDGKWVRAEGVVYDEFDPKIHIIESIAPGGRYMAAVDWGFTNPGVIQVWYVDGDGRMFLIEEVYQTGKLMSWWISKAKELNGRYGIELFVCDPAEPGNIEEFRTAGLMAIGADNRISLGIQKVKDRLTVAADGKPRLFLCQGAANELDQALVNAYKPASTEQEFGSYVWPKGMDGKPVKEIPIDEHNHGLDALRYLVMHLDGHIVDTMTMRQYLEQRGRGR